jgi:hypothetical protein
MRLRSLDLNHSTLERAVEAAIRSFSSSESTARDLILIVWNISNQNIEDTAAAIIAIVDYLEEEDKKRALLGSWNGFKIEVNSTNFFFHSHKTIFSNANNFLISFRLASGLAMQKSHLAVFSMPSIRRFLVHLINRRETYGIV